MDPSASSVDQNMLDNTKLPHLTMSQLKYIRVYQALRDNKWRILHAANDLDITVRTVRDYIAKFLAAGFTIPDFCEHLNDDEEAFMRKYSRRSRRDL